MTDFQDDEAKLYADMKAELEADGVDMSDVDVPGGSGSREDGPPVGAGPYGGNADEADDGGGDDDAVQRAAMTAEQYLEQMQSGQQYQQGPDLDSDPVSYFESRINALEQQRSGEQIFNAVRDSEAEIASRVPDYAEACDHLENARRRELSAMYPDDSPHAHLMARQAGFRTPAELREAQLNQDRITVAMQAVQSGRSPAQMYYDLAMQRGYQGRGGSARGGKPVGHDRLLGLYHDDPDAFDREWEKLANSGKL